MPIRSLLTRRTIVLSLAWTGLVGVMGELVARQRAMAVARGASEESVGQARLIARTLNQSLETARGIALTFRVTPAAADLLSSLPTGMTERVPDSTARRALLSARPDVAAVSETFAANVRAVGVLGALFLQDTRGLIVASSDRELASSRIGRVAPAAFVQRLKTEDQVQLFAPNLLTGRPGILFGAPILRGTRPIGAVVARVEADTITGTLVGAQQTLVLVTDSTGRVVASSDPRQVLRRVALPNAVADAAVAALPTVASALGPMYERPGGSSDLRATWATVPLEEFGLELHVVRRLIETRSQLNDTRLIALLLWLVGIGLLVARARGAQQLAAVANAQRLALNEQQRVAEILNTSYEAVVTLDGAHRVVDWNARAELMFGFSAAEMVGTDPTDRIVPKRWRTKHGAGFENALRIGKTASMQKVHALTALNRKGVEFPVEVTVSPATDADGGRLFVAFFLDVTQRRQEEQARLEAAERTDRYRSVLLEVSQEIKTEWIPALRHLLRETNHAVQVTRTSFWSLDAPLESMTCELMVGAEGDDPTSEGLSLTAAQSPGYFRAIRRGQPIVASDAVTHAATREFADSYLRPAGIASILDVPVWFEGRQIGLLSLQLRGTSRTWEPETVEFAVTIAGRIGLLQESVRRLQSERALEEERSRNQIVMSRTPIAQVVWDAHAGLVTANPAAVALFGFPDDASMKGKFPWEVSPPEQPTGETSRALGAQYVERCMTTGSATFEWIFRRDDGSDFPASVSLVRLTDSGSQRVSTIIDLTERKRAEHALKEARTQLTLALQSANMGTWKYLVPENRLEADDNTKSLYGLDGVALDGTMGQWFTFIHPDDLAPLGAIMQQTMADRRVDYRTTFRVVLPAGGVRHIMSAGKFAYAPDGTPLVANGVVWDITDVKRAEESLRHANFLSDQALDLTNAGYWHVPLDGSGWFNSSERACRVFGDIPREGFRYRVMEEWFANVEAGDKAASEETLKNFNAAVEGRIPKYDSVYAYKRPIDGRIIWIHAMGHVVKDASGTPTDMYGVTVDITDSRRLEDALRAATVPANAAPVDATAHRAAP